MKFNIFGKTVTYKKVKNLESESNILGQYNSKRESIIVDYDLKGDDLVRVELHEFVHAVCNRLGLHNANFSHDLEEIIADGIATALSENANIKWKNKK